MNELAVSELQQITVEIKVLKYQTAQNIIEIGKRLKHVKGSLDHGEYLSWLEHEVEFSRQTAHKFMQAAEQFENVATSRHLETGKLFEMLSLPTSVDRQEFTEESHTVPSSGESKTVDEMTVRELREVKQAVKEAERAKQEAEQRAKRAEEKAKDQESKALDFYRKNRDLAEQNERLKREKNPDPIEIEKVVYKTPESVEQRLSDYEITLADTRSKLESTKAELASMQLRNVDGFDPEQAKAKRQRLQLESDISTLQLKVHVDEFLSKTSHIAFMEGALASAELGVKQKLMDAVSSVEKFLSTVKRAVNSKIVYEEGQFREG